MLRRGGRAERLRAWAQGRWLVGGVSMRSGRAERAPPFIAKAEEEGSNQGAKTAPRKKGEG